MSLSDTDIGSWNSFINLCIKIEGISSRLSKTAEIKKFLSFYNGDLCVFLYLMLPKATHRRYQMNRKRTLQLFASVFSMNYSDLNDLMTTGQYAGYLGEVISHCFDRSTVNLPQKNKKSILTMAEIDNYLILLTKETKQSSQEILLNRIVLKCNKLDLKWFIRSIDRDLKIMVGNQTCLDGVHKNAYNSYQIKASLDYIASNIDNLDDNTNNNVMDMLPLKPMLAAACKSYKMAFEKCKSGIIYAEIKYDGERVQIHFDGKEWKFYSRSLKPVQSHKICDVENHVKSSIPNAKSLILDSEILMVDKNTGKPLPFTSLGKHKRAQFTHSTPCLFVFDILYFNGKSLINSKLIERRKLLEKEFNIIPNKIHLSELSIIKKEIDLKNLMEKMIGDNQEGLVLKDSEGVYAPNKRHWLKMKKDYLGEEGVMADSADLVVLGAYKGSGRHGGLFSTFLMGSLDPDNNTFVTVCKAHNGLSDEQIQDFTDSLSSTMIDFDRTNIPQWLIIHTSLYPDWIVRNPKKSPIFEVSGFEFSESKVHTATDYNGKGFSIRFPRITKIRDDKKYKDATNLKELRALIKTSRDDPMSAINGKNKNKKKNTNNDNNDNNNKKNKNNKKRKQQTINDLLQPPKKKRKMDVDNTNNMDINDDDDDDDDDDIDRIINDNHNHNNNNNDDNDNEEDIDLKIDVAPKPSSPPPVFDDMPLSPKTLNDDRTKCQYDEDCYRKKVDHFKEYQHPQKELNERKCVSEETKKNMEGIIKRRGEMKTAANINKKKKLNKAKEEYEEIMRKAKEKYDELVENAENQYNKIINKAQKEYDEKIIPIKQNQQFQLEKIDKKYHPQ